MWLMQRDLLTFRYQQAEPDKNLVPALAKP